jgi:hypothetical protein
VRDDNLDSRNLALLDMTCRETAESVVASERITIADYENLLHQVSSISKNQQPTCPASAGWCSPMQDRAVAAADQARFTFGIP